MKLNELKTLSLLAILILIVLLPSCRESRQKAVTPAEIVAKVDVSESDKGFDVCQIANLEKVIPLETVGNALIGEIDKLEMDDNHIVILDKRMRAVWLFGTDGKFIRRIGCLGNGPKEYVSLDDMCFDKENGTVWIWDRVKQVMLEYDLTGELLKEVATGFSSNVFARTRNGFWLYYSYLKNPDNNSLILVNEEMDHLVKGFFPTKESYPVSLSSGFTFWGEKAYFYFPLSNVLYSLDGTEARPYIEFDFGERTLPYSKVMNMSREEYETLVGSGSYLGGLNNIRLSDKYCFFRFSSTVQNKYVTEYYGVLDLETSKVEVFSYLNISDLLVDFSSLLCVTANDELVYPIYPSKHHPIYYDELRTLVPDVTEESNPILALYKCKETSDVLDHIPVK